MWGNLKMDSRNNDDIEKNKAIRKLCEESLLYDIAINQSQSSLGEKMKSLLEYHKQKKELNTKVKRYYEIGIEGAVDKNQIQMVVKVVKDSFDLLSKKYDSLKENIAVFLEEENISLFWDRNIAKLEEINSSVNSIRLSMEKEYFEITKEIQESLNNRLNSIKNGKQQIIKFYETFLRSSEFVESSFLKKKLSVDAVILDYQNKYKLYSAPQILFNKKNMQIDKPIQQSKLKSHCICQ